MKRRLLHIALFITLLTWPTDGSAQNVEWVRQIASDAAGTSASGSYSVEVDQNGNVYSFGTYKGDTDFSAGSGNYSAYSESGSAYIQKLDSLGNLIWVKSLVSDTGVVAIVSSTIDSLGNIYCFGYIYLETVDLDPGLGTFFHSSGFSQDLFVLKLNSDGIFLWVKILDANDGDWNTSGAMWATSIGIDNSGNIYLSGYFNDTVDFDPGPGTFIINSQTVEPESFLLKLDSLGNFVWVNYLSSTVRVRANSLAIDNANNIYVSGVFKDSTDFATLSGGYLMYTTNLAQDVFLQKLDSTGNTIYVKHIESPQRLYSNAITIDQQQNLILTGGFEGITDFDPSTSTLSITPTGVRNLFVEKFDTLGNMVWIKDFIGDYQCDSWDILTDSLSNIYIGGGFNETVDFDPGPSDHSIRAEGESSIGANNEDMFLLKLTDMGDFEWVRQIGNYDSDYITNIAIDKDEKLYATGMFGVTVYFQSLTGESTLTVDGSLWDNFVFKLNQTPYTYIPPPEPPLDGEFNIYPNPVYYYLKIHNGIGEVVDLYICDNFGREVLKISTDSQETWTDLSKLAKGTYHVRYIINGESKVQKFIKM